MYQEFVDIVNFQEGIIIKKDDDEYLVQTDDGIYRAYVASSCMLRPDLYDKVLLFNGTESYIISVLRHISSDYHFSLGKDSVCDCTEGNLLIKARNISLESECDFEINSAKICQKSEDFKIESKSIREDGERILVKSDRIEIQANIFIQRLNKLLRWVKDFQNCTIGRLKYLVSGLVWLKGNDAVILAEKKVRIDGEKINLG